MKKKIKNILDKFLSIKLTRKESIRVTSLAIALCIILVLVFNSENKKEEGVFTQEILSEEMKKEMLDKNIWNDSCKVPIDRLRLLTVSYINFADKTMHDGKIMVMDVAAESVLRIFKELFVSRFPIAKIKLINEYNGDDMASMNDNNTSAFNCRKITNAKSLSSHAFGLAIDINPLQNPYVENEYNVGKESINIYPAGAMEYLNRTILKPGMVENSISKSNGQKQSVVKLFKDNGFAIWGGDWEFPIDWHHFQVQKDKIAQFVEASFEEGQDIFHSMVKQDK